MAEEVKLVGVKYKYIHPRLKEVLADLAPPSPVAVPRDSSQPRVGYLMTIHKEGYLTPPPEIVLPCDKNDKPEVRLSLDSFLLKRRREK